MLREGNEVSGSQLPDSLHISGHTESPTRSARTWNVIHRTNVNWGKVCRYCKDKTQELGLSVSVSMYVMVYLTQLTLSLNDAKLRSGVKDLEQNKHQLLHRIASIKTPLIYIGVCGIFPEGQMKKNMTTCGKRARELLTPFLFSQIHQHFICNFFVRMLLQQPFLNTCN